MPTLKEYQENYDLRWRNGIYSIDEDALILHGGGDFYNPPENPDLGHVPDTDTMAQGYAIAKELNKHILGVEGSWYGYSEYTPDPWGCFYFQMD